MGTSRQDEDNGTRRRGEIIGRGEEKSELKIMREGKGREEKGI
jgi:hypothetical protein